MHLFENQDQTQPKAVNILEAAMSDDQRKKRKKADTSKDDSKRGGAQVGNPAKPHT